MVDPPSQAWRILVVDDEQSVQGVLQRLFERMGQTMRGTLSSAEAMTLLGQPWDLFLIDKNLPQGSGIEVAKAARAAHPEAIIILVTAFASRDSAEELIGVVDEYVTKPFELSYLREIIVALMDFREIGRLARAISAPRASPSALQAMSPPARPTPPSRAATSSVPTPPRPGLTPAPTPPPGPPRSGLTPAPTPPPGVPRSGLTPTPTPPGAAARGRPARALVHILLSDGREEALFLSETRKAGVSASSGPLTDTMFPDVLIIDGKSATFEVRKAVWSRQARVPALRVVMVVDSTLADSTAALALKAMFRLQRPLTPAAVAPLFQRLKL
ncbi:MAG: response regulator [Archangium sp.]|nr:response regulator [Archangium sp.]